MVRNFPQTAVTPPSAFPARIHRIVSENANEKASQTPGLHSALQARLLSLPFAAFAQCVCDLLRAEGYTHVRLAKRATFKGRNKESGYDIEACRQSPLGQKVTTSTIGDISRRKVIVRIKQFQPDTNVFLRMHDELRGACLRAGAIEAVLITTSDFSPVIRDAEDALRHDSNSRSLAPVHLLNGQTLVERLIEHRIGVQEVHKTNAALVLDTAYFASIGDSPKGDKITETSGDKGRGNGTPAVTIATMDERQPNGHNRLTVTFAFDMSATLSPADTDRNRGNNRSNHRFGGKGGA